MLGAVDSEVRWLLIALVCVWAILMCLKTICLAIDNDLVVHNLKLQVRTIRRAHLEKIRALQAAQLARTASPASFQRRERKGPEESEVKDQEQEPRSEQPAAAAEATTGDAESVMAA